MLGATKAQSKILILSIGIMGFSTNTYSGVNTWTGIGPDGGQTNDIIFQPTNSTTLYAATAGGIFKSSNDGQIWSQSLSGFSYELSITSDGSQIFAGTSSGLKTSINDGATWSTVNLPSSFTSTVTDLDINEQAIFIRKSNNDLLFSTDLGINFSTLPAFTQASTINDILIDSTTTSRSYLATNQGIYFSSNSGVDWTLGNIPTGYENVSDISNDPNNPSTFYAATSAGALKSINSGITWVAVSADRLLNSIETDPKNSNIVYSANNSGTSAELYRSLNAGTTWTQVGNIRSNSIAIHPTTADKLFAGNFGDLLVSTDSGASWLSSSAGIQSSNPSFITVHPSTGNVYAGGISSKGLFSGSANSTLLPVQNGLNASPVYSVAFDTFNPNTIYAGGFGISGGVYKTTDNGSSWLRNISGLSNSAILSIATSALDSDLVFAGTSDTPFNTNNLNRSVDGASSWQQIASPTLDDTDINSIAIDTTNDSIIYVATTTAGIAKSIDRGITWSSSNSGLPNTLTINGTPFISLDEVIINPNDSNDVWAFAGDRVFRSTNAASSWSEPLPFSVDGKNIAFHPSESSTFYIGTNQTKDGGTTWCNITSGLDSNILAEKIALSDSDPELLYITTQFNGAYSLELIDQIPVASAGDDFTFNSSSSSSITLDASNSSDNGGCINSYEWSQLSGPTLNTPPSNNATTSFTAASNGVYEFELKVTDNDGNISTDNIAVTVDSSLLSNNNSSTTNNSSSGGGGGGGGGTSLFSLLMLTLMLLFSRQRSRKSNSVN